MAFEDKKGIVVASPFKLQAEALLDVRQQVDTIAERDRLVTLKAATAGLRVFVKENSTSYVYTGSKWDPLATGAPYKHPTGDGNHHVPATGTTNAGKYLKAGATAGSEAWSKIAASDITGLPTRLPNPQTLTIRSNDTNTSVDYTGAEAKTLTMSPEWVYGASDAPLSKIAEYSEKGTRYVKVLDIESNKDNLYGRVQQQFLIMGLNFSFILNLCAYQSNSKIFNRYSASYITTSADGVDDSRFLLGVKNINSESNKIELWYKQDQWTSALAVLPKGRSGETTRVFNLYSVNNTDHPVTTAPVFDISIPIKNNYKIYTTTGQATDGSMTQKAITDALNSKASSSHTHTAGQITGLPTSLKNPYALTIKTNGTSAATYDGSVVKEVNITAASIGAAASSHGHSAFKGATGTVAGGTGFVPAPAIGEQDKFLRGDGTWQPISLTLSALGVTATAAELNYMKGVTSAVQTQLNNKAPASHTHPVSQITGLPTKLPNPQALKFTGAVTATYDGSGAVTVNIPTAQASPHALTVQLNGGSTENTNKFTFNGGAAKNINITPASIGAAASTHSHNYAGSGSVGGAANSAVKLTTARTINGVLFDGTNNIEIPNNYSKALNAEDLNTILAIGEYYAGGGNTVKNKPSGVQHFGMKVYKVASGYIAQKLHGSDNIIYYRVHDNASFGAWQKVYSTAAKPTATEIGAAPSSHNHTASQITGLPTKLPNPQPLKFTGAATATYDGSGAVTINIPTAQASPHALTVQLNGGTTEGTNKFTFNGGAAKNINITPASIGAALASHTHSGYAPTSHTHTAGQITGLPTSLKNPYALTIKTNGSAAAIYDGSAVKEVNITAAGIGAAATSHGHNLGNGTTPGFTKLYKWEDNPSTEDFTGAITPQFLAQYTTNKIVPRISENANNISKIVNGTTPVGKSKQLVDSVNNQGIGLTYDEISETGPFDRCKFAMFYNNSIIGGMTPNRVTDFIGAAKSNHTHTPASIGAAPSSHTHNYAGSSSAGGPANSAKKVDFPVGTVLWTTSSSATFFSSTCGGTWEVVGNIDTIINSSTTLTLYMHKKKAL